jgi:hypothetical protein
MPQIPEGEGRKPAHYVEPGTELAPCRHGRGYLSACGAAYCLPIYGWDRNARIYAHKTCPECAATAPYPMRRPIMPDGRRS